MRCFLLLALFLSGCAGSFSQFSQEDYQYQAMATVITAADWNQTMQFKDKGHKERNPILGDYPTDSKINTLIPLSIVGQWLVTWALPAEYRRKWQLGILAIETGCVVGNYNAGVRINF